jgi:cell division transport system permease protein
MSRSYDRSPPLPPGTGGTGPNDPFDAPFDGPYDAPYETPYDGYDDPTGRPQASPQYTRDGRQSAGLRPQPLAGAANQARPLDPQELSRPSRPRTAVTFDAGLPAPGSAAGREMYAPARSKRADKTQAHAPIVPAGSITGRSLTLVISIMCFLACLTAGAVYLINQSAAAWLRDIASEVTVQIEPRDKAETEKTVRDVVQFLGRQPGVRSVRPLAVEESAALLEPWLGSSDALKTLPMPRLVSIELDRSVQPDFVTLRANLTKQFKGVSLDDHRQWQQQIRTVTRSFALGGIAILLLVAAATTAIIISATRAAMASNRDIVEVLHFVGATDRFIAREFERNFMRLGIRAGLVGAMAAMLVFALMPTAMELLGGGSVSLAEVQRLVGTGTLDWMGYALLAALVVVVAILCRFTSRFSVSRILHSRN